eukprot:4480058-Pleurochrysis_carterae.AAC.1
MIASRSPRLAGCLAAPARGRESSARRRRREERNVMSEVRGAKGSRAEAGRRAQHRARATRRDAANANGKGGWGQKGLRERGAGAREREFSCVTSGKAVVAVT